MIFAKENWAKRSITDKPKRVDMQGYKMTKGKETEGVYMLLRDRKRIVWKETLPFVCIWIAVFLVGTIAIYLPGVYYDAVYPDYLAAIGAFPGVDNFTQITRHVGLPLLGNFYHGTMSAGFQFIILKCIGHTSQFTLRAANLICFSVIGSLIYILCRRVSKSDIIPLIGTLLCVTAPNVLTFPRTQYYIMLHGCIFLFCSILLLCIDIDRGESFRTKIILTAGVFQGLAFYGYFTYLFFTPASMILIAFFSKGTMKQRIKKELIYMWGILIGSIGYFIGYYDSFLTNLLGEVLLTRILLLGGILCMAAYLAVPVYLSWKHESDNVGRKIGKVFLIINVAVLLAACFVGIVMFFLYEDKLSSILNFLVLSQTRNQGNRFLIFWQMMYELISNRSAQNLIFGETLNGLSGVYFYLGILLTVATGTIAFLYKKKEKDSLLKYIGTGYLYLAVYYIFTLPISAGMQPQHFVATYFLLFTILILDMVFIGRHVSSKWLRISMGFSVLLLGMCLNITSDRIFLKKLYQTEGRGKYSSALDQFAEEAYLDMEKDNKIYVFPQWGFNANFIYLTENTCMTIRDEDIDYEALQEKLESGYTLVIAAFDRQEINNIVTELEAGFWEWHEMESKEGDYVFTYVTIAS